MLQGDVLDLLGTAAAMAMKCFEEGGNRTSAFTRLCLEENHRR